MAEDLTTYRALGEALAIGLLVGIERYKSRDEGERQSAGVRTFAVIGLLGGVCALLDPILVVLTLGALVIFLALGYWRESERSVGTTTETATLLTFWLGYLTHTHETLAVGCAIVLVVVLAHKEALHGFVRFGLSELELYDSLKFLLVVFVVYPLLPTEYLTDYELIRPSEVWLLVILVSSISYTGYVLVRLLGERRGTQLGALVGGLVSTTAVTMALAARARELPQASRLHGVTVVLANAVQGPRLAVLLLAVDPELAALMALPLVGMGIAGAGGALLLGRVARVWQDADALGTVVRNPYSFLPALKFALLFAVVLVGAKLAAAYLGDSAILVVSAVAGVADASAISLTLGQMSAEETLALSTAAWAILVAVAVNALTKLVLAVVQGTPALFFWLLGGFVTMLGAAGGLLLLSLRYLV